MLAVVVLGVLGADHDLEAAVDLVAERVAAPLAHRRHPPGEAAVLGAVHLEQLVVQLDELALARRLALLRVEVDVHGDGADDVEGEVDGVLQHREFLARAGEAVEVLQEDVRLVEDAGQQRHQMLWCEAGVKALAELLPFLFLEWWSARRRRIE